ncbi:hypothetical protein D3C87_1517750 [compost metagenome]
MLRTNLLLQGQQRQFDAQMAGEQVLATQAVQRIVAQFAFDQLRVGFANVDADDQLFQVTDRHPGRQRRGAGAAHGFVAQWQGDEVLQRQVNQAQGGAFGFHQRRKAAPHHHAVDHDFDVRQVQLCGVGMLFDHGIAQLIQRELADWLDTVLKGLPAVLTLYLRQIHQMTAIRGEVNG